MLVLQTGKVFIMKKSSLTLMASAVVLLFSLPARSAVQVMPRPESEPAKEPAQPAAPSKPAGAVDKPVAFEVDGKYLTADPGNALDLMGDKIGSKQGFTLVDVNGGELADGDEVRIQYIPGKGHGRAGDPTKSSFWVETPEGIRRNREGGSFRIKQVGDKYAFQTDKGKFVGPPAAGGFLTLVDKQEGAMLVKIIDLSHGIPKKPKAPKTEVKETTPPGSSDKSSEE
ncbi:MAG TPA: hypothetical protein VL171_14595 [Verrucomicrobiae bacterium]|nr:hypothetical protein [Verrucomicrobiae bacterium]